MPELLTREDAVRVARERILLDSGPSSLEGRTELEGDNWHVSFPLADIEKLGGEPHVVVAEDGTALRRYSTQ